MLYVKIAFFLKMGYGLQALKLLQAYYEGKFLLSDNVPDQTAHEIESVTEEVRFKCLN